MKMSKEYKKQLKDPATDIKNIRDSLAELLEYDETKGGKTSATAKKGKKKGNEADMWQCQRINDEQAYLKNIPLGEKES